MIGYWPGASALHRAHPYTALAAAGSLLLAAFAVTTPAAVGVVVLAAVALALLGGVLGRVARPAFVIALPTWAILLVIHGLLGHEPFGTVLGVRVSEAGLTRALVLGGRLSAILVAFLTVLAVVSPARLVEAMTARGVPFARMYLLVSTLTLVPRLRERAVRILEAQQCRGLALGGSPVARVRALVPLVLPLILGALVEVDEQVLALDARGVTSGARRTSLDPPPDSPGEQALRLGLAFAVLALLVARFAGAGL
jgi:energy-coupling factor transport system permease protein